MRVGHLLINPGAQFFTTHRRNHPFHNLRRQPLPPQPQLRGAHRRWSSSPARTYWPVRTCSEACPRQASSSSSRLIWIVTRNWRLVSSRTKTYRLLPFVCNPAVPALFAWLLPLLLLTLVARFLILLRSQLVRRALFFISSSNARRALIERFQNASNSGAAKAMNSHLDWSNHECLLAEMRLQAQQVR